MSNSNKPIEPSRVWTELEWRKQQPWTSMPKGDLRTFFKNEAFIHLYSGGPNKIRDLYEKYGSPTGPIKDNPLGGVFDGKA